MNFKNSLRKSTQLIGLFTIAGAVYAQAAAVTINNPGFEEDVLGAGGWTNNAPTGWSDPQGNDNTNFVENIGGFASEGVIHVGFDANEFGMIYQDLSAAWAANTAYTLTVGVGNRNGTGAGTGRFGLGSSLDVLADPGAVGTLSEPSVFFADLDTATIAPNGGTFEDATFNFSTGAVAPAGSIRVSAQWVSGTRIHVDNFRLDARVIPEPTSLAMLGLCSGLMLRRRRA